MPLTESLVGSRPRRVVAAVAVTVVLSVLLAARGPVASVASPHNARVGATAVDFPVPAITRAASGDRADGVRLLGLTSALAALAAFLVAMGVVPLGTDRRPAGDRRRRWRARLVGAPPVLVSPHH